MEKKEEKIDHLIEEVKSLVPSSGFWPLTLLRLDRSNFEDISFKQQIRSSHLLLFLMRTDFKITDVRDFLLNSEELSFIPPDMQLDFADKMLAKIQNDNDLNFWKERIISMCIGIAMLTAEKMNLGLQLIYADLCEIDKAFGYRDIHLFSYMLFNVEF